MTNVSKTGRTTHALRDILFNEIERLATDSEADPRRAVAISNLARQIIATAKVELDFHRTMTDLSQKGTEVSLGELELGSPIR